MSAKLILILEDNEDRIRNFQNAVASLGEDFSVKIWNDAPTMIAELSSKLNQACLISLDHDLNPQPNVTTDPGTGLEVAEFLTKQKPICPVLIHSTNHEKAWSMHNELRFAGWPVDRVGPIGDDWIQCLWLPKVKSLLEISN
jgi:CheY-like chemotaxis protein